MSSKNSNGHTCPVSGQDCIHGIAVMDRTMSIRRWLGGKVKALVCSHECAAKWAKLNNRKLAGDSMTTDGVKKETIILFQYPEDQPVGRYQS